MLLRIAISACLVVVATTAPPPLYKAPLWTTGVNARLDLCSIQTRVANGTIGLRDSLRGCRLSFVFGIHPPFSDKDEAGGLDDDGILADLSDELARRAGFEWRNSYALLDPPTQGRTYTKWLTYAVKHDDATADYFLHTTDRLNKGVTFPEGWYDASLILIVPTRIDAPSAAETLFSWLKPFGADVWALVGLMFMLTAFVYWLLERDQVEGDLEDKDAWLQICMSVFLGFTVLTGGGGNTLSPKSVAGMLLASGWSLFCLLHVSAYTANLCTFLVLKSIPVAGINSIYEAVAQNRVICVWGAAADYELLRNEHPSGNYRKSLNHQGAIQDLNEGLCDAAVVTYNAWDVLRQQQNYNGNCTLKYVGRPIINIQAGFAVAQDTDIYCSSMIRDVFDIHFKEMKRDGFLDTAWLKHVERSLAMPETGGAVACKSERRKGTDAGAGGAGPANDGTQQISVKSKVLKLEDMGGTHSIYGVFLLTSFVCWALSTKTAKGRKFIVPCLHRKSSSTVQEVPDEVAQPACIPQQVDVTQSKQDLEPKVEVYNAFAALPGGIESKVEDLSRGQAALKSQIEQLTADLHHLISLVEVQRHSADPLVKASASAPGLQQEASLELGTKELNPVTMSAKELNRIILSGQDASVPDSKILRRSYSSMRTMSAVFQSTSPVKARQQPDSTEVSMWPVGSA